MLIEQAFFNMPEILVGAGYAKQEYEAGIVSAFSLALLQELNGRNASNPISCITAEKRFSPKAAKLRADLYVRLSRLLVGTRNYSEFGFRYNNWIEAKYFRSGAGTIPSTQNLGQVAADLIRLAALVPLQRAKDQAGKLTDKLISGRYFLHVYYGDPLQHLNPKRKTPKDGQTPTREWVAPLLNPGANEIKDLELIDESVAFFTHLGSGLKTLKCSMKITNLVIAPRRAADTEFYTFVLTRIDEAELEFNGRSFAFSADRTFACNPASEFEEFRDDVISHVKPKKATTPTKSVKKKASRSKKAVAP
jgi:hypothetical protein